ncbi:MAG: hypothetical protein H6830_12410 [Planctomycetes bacterium]|nr:hypothetical protein [Planctomycetota bacterium]HPF12853.1 hypothetical protein [Planctomycetota bacterium]HRV79842.1 hypothetical protein [Planctomycetota bacterium]
MKDNKRRNRIRTGWLVALGSYLLIAACATLGPRDPRLHGWWKGLGLVLPHDSFPGDCSLCHVGGSWNTLVEDFEFDHEARTGVALNGAHAKAQCLLCHNDRGPVQVFQAQGCAGCHEDIHLGYLGPNCTDCHRETSWRPFGQVERHAGTRFPLVGRHATASCRACHLGNEVGRFLPVDTACVSCHRRDLAATQNPNHNGLGWVDHCDRCHLPTTWHQAQVVPF